MRAAAALAFAVALRMSLAGRGGSEDEVEEVDEAEDEEEVVDAGWAVMRAGLRAAVSAAATAGRMEGMSPGCRLGAGGWGGPVVTWRPGGPIWSAAAGEGGAGLRPSLSGLGWARVNPPSNCIVPDVPLISEELETVTVRDATRRLPLLTSINALLPVRSTVFSKDTVLDSRRNRPLTSVAIWNFVADEKETVDPSFALKRPEPAKVHAAVKLAVEPDCISR